MYRILLTVNLILSLQSLGAMENSTLTSSKRESEKKLPKTDYSIIHYLPINQEEIGVIFRNRQTFKTHAISIEHYSTKTPKPPVIELSLNAISAIASVSLMAHLNNCQKDTCVKNLIDYRDAHETVTEKTSREAHLIKNNEKDFIFSLAIDEKNTLTYHYCLVRLTEDEKNIPFLKVYNKAINLMEDHLKIIPSCKGKCSLQFSK